jgi:hypothetical protein
MVFGPTKRLLQEPYLPEPFRVPGGVQGLPVDVRLVGGVAQFYLNKHGPNFKF